MKIVYYLVFVFTTWVVNDLLMWAVEGTAREIVNYSFVGLVALAYFVLMASISREGQPKKKYPSTVRAKLEEGFKRGVNGGGSTKG